MELNHKSCLISDGSFFFHYFGNFEENDFYMQIPTLNDILAAHSRIEPFINHTPVLSSHQLNDIFDCELFFKCENFSKSGRI